MARIKETPRRKKPRKVGKDRARTEGVGASRRAGMGQQRRKHRYRPGTKALQEIRKYQRSSDLLLRKLPFARLVKQLCHESFTEPGKLFRWQATALDALQEVAEEYLVQLMADA